MAEIQTAETQTNNGLSPQILRQLRQLRRDFEANVLPQAMAKRSFEKGGRRKRTKPTCRKPNIRFSPFAMILGNDLPNIQPSIRQNHPVRTAIIPVQTGQLVSVFIVATVTTNPPVYVIQKVQKKSAPGFPGGGIEEGETILETGIREFKEESRGKDLSRGVDIAPYNPICIGKIVLDRAESGEQGAVVLVEIPESEIANLKAGGGAEEGEVVEELFFWTFDEVSERAGKRAILTNSVKIWNLYLNHLVKTP